MSDIATLRNDLLETAQLATNYARGMLSNQENPLDAVAVAALLSAAAAATAAACEVSGERPIRADRKAA